jgi:hypothetical protein
MALKPLQAIMPIGQFDGYDYDFQSTKGGEVCSIISVPTTEQPGVSQPGFDKASFDSFDGYVEPGTVKRPVVTHTNMTATMRPLMLTDDGIVGYGTLFGAVVGGTVGQQVNGPNLYTGAILGPHTATGSGKITCWMEPGLYAVTLDAVDTAPTTGLQPTNSTLDVGAALTYSASGLLTPVAGGSGVAGAPVVARLVEFATNGSLVTTTHTMVTAYNSPLPHTAPGPRQFSQVVIFFNAPVA